MILSYEREFLSVTPFHPVALSPFTVLTGVNGAGKTHLLQALKEGHVRIEGISPDQIILFDHNLFGLDDEPIVSLKSLQEERKAVYDALSDHLNSRNFIAPLREVVEVLAAIAHKKGVGFYDLTAEDLQEEGMAEFYPSYQDYRINALEVINPLTAQTNPRINRPALQRLIGEIKKPLELLTREELDHWYMPLSYKNDFLIQELGKVFSDYWAKWELNVYRTFRNERFKESHFTYSEEEFIQEFGERPWRVINAIMARFGNLDYQVNNPEGLERGHDYQLKLVSTRNERVAVDFSRLSSGERILMALVSCVYKAKVDRQLPGLLLLDGIDAFLHPGMTRILLDVLAGEFVQKRGLKVLLNTQSPSTVALAPEGSVFVMKKSEANRIVASDNKAALYELAEGFVPLTLSETQLKVSYHISKASDCVLLTEGITDKIILEAAWYNLENRELSFDIQDGYGAGFLETLFACAGLFTSYPTKTFVALFDFDEQGFNAWNHLPGYDLIGADPGKGLLKKHPNHRAYALLLPVPKGTIQSQVMEADHVTYRDRPHMPIELLFYGVPTLDARFISEPRVEGGTLIRLQGDKTSFASEVATRLGPDDFETLKPLFASIKNIFQDKGAGQAVLKKAL